MSNNVRWIADLFPLTVAPWLIWAVIWSTVAQKFVRIHTLVAVSLHDMYLVDHHNFHVTDSKFCSLIVKCVFGSLYIEFYFGINFISELMIK